MTDRRDWQDDLDRIWPDLKVMGQESDHGFEQLIKRRVRNVLLVASLYDAFTLEEGGRLTELLLSEYRELNLSSSPHITRATSGDEALEQIREHEFDLVLTMTRIGEMGAYEFANDAKQIDKDLPVVVLGYNARELEFFYEESDSPIDLCFVWTGDVRLLLAIIKCIEDRWNVADDTRYSDVRCIILVEDSIRFYSAYLPLIYREVMRQTQGLMADSANLSQKLLRMRARPKILFATCFEEAWSYYEKYSTYVLGVITDARFPWDGEVKADAGVEFVRRLRRDDQTLPIVVQSSEIKNRAKAQAEDAFFIDKKSPSLLDDLRGFMRAHFGFGDFIFRLPDGTEVGRAHNTRALIREITRVPEESIAYHAAHDHFSNWFRARTRFGLANIIKPLRVSEFDSTEQLCQYMVDTFTWHREQSRLGIITDFSLQDFDADTGFTRIGTGALGGKARGLAFMNKVLNRHDVRDQFPDVDIMVPSTAVVATDVFDEFMETVELRDLALGSTDDEAIAAAFLEAKLPPAIYDDLRAFLEEVHYPLAVRSSSLLEDAQHQPFAGVYRTYMIPNNHDDLGIRLDQLCDAIKLVYASTFYQGAKSYLAATSNRVEEEKMAVVIQRIVGRRHEDFVYPNFAGVAHSTNHYATDSMRQEDGVCLAALGLGRTVVDGGQCLRFSPREPQRILQFATVEDTLRNSQSRFQALNVGDPEAYPSPDEESNVPWLDLADAERHGTLAPVGSVFSAENDAIYDGISRAGPRLVSFAYVLKSGLFPLADIVSFLLDLCRRCMSCEVEMEFAVNLHDGDEPDEFGLLQVRPLAANLAAPDLSEDLFSSDGAVIATQLALGNGQYDNIHDIVLVDRERFDRGHTLSIAEEVGGLNDRLLAEGRPYLLIGPGRWGSSDRWLGVPVNWSQIAGASVIVETDLEEFKVTPSQGTHFFQNLTSFRIGYLTVNQASGGGILDWDWLEAQACETETEHLRHIRLDDPLRVLIDGRSGKGVVLEPDSG